MLPLICACLCLRWLSTICWSCSSQTPVPCLRKRLSLSSMMKWYVCLNAVAYNRSDYAASISVPSLWEVENFDFQTGWRHMASVFWRNRQNGEVCLWIGSCVRRRDAPDFVVFVTFRSSRILQPWCSSYWPHQDNSPWEHTSMRQSVCTHNEHRNTCVYVRTSFVTLTNCCCLWPWARLWLSSRSLVTLFTKFSSCVIEFYV